MWTVAALVLAGLLQSGKTPTTKMADLVVIPVNGFGKIPGNAAVVVDKTATGERLHVVPLVGSPVKLKVPPGKYTVAFSPVSGTRVVREVVVQPAGTTVVLPVDGPLSEFLPSDRTLLTVFVGQLESCSASGVVWLRLIGLYSDHVADEVVTDSHVVQFEDVRFGVYKLVVLDGELIRGEATVRVVKRAPEVAIDALPCPASNDRKISGR